MDRDYVPTEHPNLLALQCRNVAHLLSLRELLYSAQRYLLSSSSSGHPSTASQKFWAFTAFAGGIPPIPEAFSQRMVPDVIPTVLQDISESFKVALARIDASIWANTHIYSRSCARLYSKPQIYRVHLTVLRRRIP